MMQHDILSGQTKQAVDLNRTRALHAFRIDLHIHSNLADIEQEWRDFETHADRTAFQSFDWLAKWQKHIGNRKQTIPAIVVGRESDGQILFIFHLAVEPAGGIRRLKWLASDLCDYNAPLLGPRFTERVTPERFVLVWRDIIALLSADRRFRFDLIDLPKMPEMIGGQRNPFLSLELQANPSGAYVATLGHEWESYYAAKRSSATRKKERRQLKQLAEHGEPRFLHALEGAEAERTIEALFQQKSHSLSRMGAEDIFQRPGYRDFFRDVVTDGRMREIAHITRFDLGEIIGAVNLVLTFRDRFYLVLSSYHDGSFTRYGPGRALLYDLLRESMARGYRYFDFTIGDEGYKRDWSDIELSLFDHLAAASLRGRAMLALTASFRRTKRLIKQNPRLWRAFSKMRAMTGRNAAREKAPAPEREE